MVGSTANFIGHDGMLNWGFFCLCIIILIITSFNHLFKSLAYV